MGVIGFGGNTDRNRATAVAAQQTTCTQLFLPVSPPLTDLGNNEYVRMDGQITGFSGGLYPDGRNLRPPEHEAAGQAIAVTIIPLNEAGEPDSHGRIGFISVGMSNTASEFQHFMNTIHLHPQVNPQVKAVNGAQGGRTADRWAATETDVWLNLDTALQRANTTPEQVQVAWIKLTLTGGGDFPEKAELLQANLTTIVQELKVRFPNLKMAYLSSRTRSYLYERGLSPEPAAFETGFAVKWLIEQQINGDPALNFDPAKGEVLAPYLSWGPYLWIDGENARGDGRVWLSTDLAEDCTHPSRSGNEKVADMLLEFFLTDSTTGWFRTANVPVLAAPSATLTATPTATAVSPTVTPSPLPTNTTQPTTTPTTAPTTVPALPETEAEQDTAVWPLAGALLALLLGVVIVVWGFYKRRG